MLYDSTKSVLRSMLRSLETGAETRWDDQTESGNECLYEMHQMSGSLDKAYKSGSLADLADKLRQLARSAPLLIAASRMAHEHLWAEALNLGGYDVLAELFEA